MEKQEDVVGNPPLGTATGRRLGAQTSTFDVTVPAHKVLLRDAFWARYSTGTELALLLTTNMFVLLNKTDLLPTSAQASTALTSTHPWHADWAVSLTLRAGTSDFLAGLAATALKDRHDVFLDGFTFVTDTGLIGLRGPDPHVMHCMQVSSSTRCGR